MAGFAVFEEIAKAGIALHSYDCHGHGRSQPLEERNRALIWQFHHVVRACSLLASGIESLQACCMGLMQWQQQADMGVW